MKLRSLLALFLCVLCLFSCSKVRLPGESPAPAPGTVAPSLPGASLPEDFSIPEYQGKPYVVIGDNTPEFSSLTTEAYEVYPSLDALGRCQAVHACLGVELMPTEDRESISSVKPSGWQSSYYDFVDGKYLYNRCHLIGFQLAGENANPNNLITGTRSMNVKGMLPFENMVADYLKETENHVMFRVTPIFVGEELVARGVRMEAYSVEDEGEGICFDVYVFNAEPGVIIHYSDGSNRAADTPAPTSTAPSGEKQSYILNTNSRKIHYPHCSSVEKISDKNKQAFRGDPSDLLAQGYSYCGICF